VLGDLVTTALMNCVHQGGMKIHPISKRGQILKRSL
jgi:hypothetical protein